MVVGRRESADSFHYRPVFSVDGVCLLVGCLTSHQHASVSQGRICSDNFACCHAEIEVADPTFYLTQSQYTDTGPISPSTDPVMSGTWQGSQWSANFEVTGMTRPRKNPSASGIWTRDLQLLRGDLNPGPSAPEADALTTRPTRRSQSMGMKSYLLLEHGGLIKLELVVFCTINT